MTGTSRATCLEPPLVRAHEDPCVYGLLMGISLSKPLITTDHRFGCSRSAAHEAVPIRLEKNLVATLSQKPLIVKYASTTEWNYCSDSDNQNDEDDELFQDAVSDINDFGVFSRPYASEPSLLTEKYDFLAPCAFPEGQEYSISFKSYLPSLFHELRTLFASSNISTRPGTATNAPSYLQYGSDGDDYYETFSPINELISCGALANSGARFFYTPDKKFILKTVSHKQVKFLLSIMGKYAEYMARTPDSKLTRIYAIYRIKWSELGATTCATKFTKKHHKNYILVMRNGLFSSDQVEGKMDVFDLKCFGLLHSRDNRDFSKWTAENRSTPLEPKELQYISAALKKDVNFLRSVGVNDYSLLIGIKHNIPLDFSPSNHPYVHISKDGTAAVYVVVIDILSPWYIERKIGNFLFPGIWLYFPRYTRPKKYAKKMIKTIEIITTK